MKNKYESWGYAFISPFLVIFLIFGLYPIINTLTLSFQRWDGLMPSSSAGTSNYRRLFSDEVFSLSILNTLRIWIMNYVPQLLTALLIATLMTFNRIRGMRFFRAAFYLPNLITAASVGLLFNLLLNGDTSAMNHLLLALGMPGAPFKFLSDPMFTSAVVSYIQWWMWFGYTTIIVMAGMLTIDKSIFEAAMVDGASKFQTFTRVTLPLINPTILYLTITSIIGGMQLFDVPVTLTNGYGDPQKAILTSTMYIYNQGFRSRNFGYASAVSMGLFVIIAVLCAVSYRFLQGRQEINE